MQQEAEGAPAEGAEQTTPERPGYFQQLPPEFVEQHGERLARYGKLSDLAGAVVSAEDRLARSVVVPKGDKPDPAELKAFREALGLPDTPDGYQIKADAAKDMEAVDAIVESVKQAAVSMSLSRTQAQKLFDYVVNTAKAGEQVSAEAAKQFDAKLLEAVGGDQGKRDGALNLHKAFMVRLGSQINKLCGGGAESPDVGSKAIKRLADAGFFHDPDFTLAFASIEARLGDEPFIDTGGPGRPAGSAQGMFGKSQAWRDTYGRQQ